MYRVDQHLTGTESEEYTDGLKSMCENRISVKEEFEDSIARHIFLELYYNHDREVLLTENFLTESELFEQYGLFPECKSIGDKIGEAVEPYLGMEVGKRYTIDIPINSAWIGNVHINVIREPKNVVKARYFPDSSKLITKTDGSKFFQDITIEINMAQVDGRLWWAKVASMHELTHAYEDFNRRNNGAEDLGSIYRKRGMSKYHGLSDKEKTEEINKLYNIFYVINSCERNAFIATIRAEFEQCPDPFSSIQGVIDWYKGTESYVFFAKTVNEFNEFVEITDPVRQKEVLSEIEKVSNLKFKNYNHFIKYASGELRKSISKLNTMIPKYAADILNLDSGTGAPIKDDHQYTKDELEEAINRFITFCGKKK